MKTTHPIRYRYPLFRTWFDHAIMKKKGGKWDSLAVAEEEAFDHIFKESRGAEHTAEPPLLGILI